MRSMDRWGWAKSGISARQRNYSCNNYYYIFYIYIALPMCLQAGIQVRFTMIYVQFNLDNFFLLHDFFNSWFTK